MRYSCCLLFFILVALPLSAAEKVEQEASPQQEQSVPQEVEKRSHPPAKSNFQPTERIEADTVVSFPADI